MNNLCKNNIDNVNNNNDYHSNKRPSFKSTKNDGKIAKSAAELLEASKPLYVKSEKVLENRQEWKFNEFFQSYDNNNQLKKSSPPPIPPKNQKFDFRNRSSNNQNNQKLLININKPPIPPKPKNLSMTTADEGNSSKNAILIENSSINGILNENHRFFDQKNHSRHEDDDGEDQHQLKNCFVSLIVPKGVVESRKVFEENKEKTIHHINREMGSSPNLHNLNHSLSYPSASDAHAKTIDLNKIAYNKRRKSMPNLIDGERFSSLGDQVSCDKLDDDENSTVGADDGSSSARWDLSIVSTTCVDNQSDISACESLTSSPRRQGATTKRLPSLPSTESDTQLNRHITVASTNSSDHQLEGACKSSSTALNKFFNSMGLEQNVWQKVNQNSNSETESVQYFSAISSVPSSVTFSKSSDSNSEGFATGDSGKRRRSGTSTILDSAQDHSKDHSNKQISIIERNARVIKWIYSCGKSE